MTYVEFYSDTAIENAASSLCQKPDRLFLVGHNKALLEKGVEKLRDFFISLDIQVSVFCLVLCENDFEGAKKAFLEVLATDDYTLFDLTGGNEVYIAAAGALSELVGKDKMGLIRFDIKNGKPVCLTPSKLSLGTFPKLCVCDNVRLYGGAVIFESEKNGASVKWELTPEFLSDIDALWNICRKSPRDWNSQISILEALEHYKNEDSQLRIKTTLLSLSRTAERHIFENSRFEVLNALYEQGFLKEYSLKNGRFEVEYKNAQIKRCLTKAGMVLELKVFALARSVSNGSSAFFNDAMSGVFVDWDGEIKGKDTENEIDVLLMRGLVPIFISCKNGFVDMDELYKLATVARRFGGKYAVKVLVATSINMKSDFASFLVNRARELDIILLTDIHELSDEEIRERLKGLVL